MLAPFAEGHFGFGEEDALDRSFAGAAVLAERLQCFRFAWIGEQRLYNSHGSRVCRMRKLQRDGINGLQLVDKDFENSLLNRGCSVQPLKCAGMENQLSQKRRDIHDKTLLGEAFDEPGKKIESSHGDEPRYGYRVRRFRRYPDGAHRRDHPDALIGAKSHDTLRGEDELIFGMAMQRDHVSIGKVGGDAGDLRERATAPVKEDAVAFFRHLLSQ